ncbi:MAG: cell division protein ZipA, partial [Pseudomonadales bacterium]
AALGADVPVLMEPVEMGRGGHKSVSHDDAGGVAPADQQTGLIIDRPIRATQNTPRQPERPEYFIVLYVTALHQPFNGQSLLESLVELDMQFGEMEIFHRMEQGESVFSLVNAVEPGTFDINQMSELQTPAVSLFMRAHDQDEPLRIYDEMIAVAQALAEELGGEVKDESKSVVTPQTIVHCREEIKDYQHRHH